MKRVLVLGGRGMLGHRLFLACRDRFDTWMTVRSDADDGYRFGDVSRVVPGVDALQPETVSKAIRAVGPDVVVNAIGIVKQVPAASDPLANIAVNALFPHRLASLCAVDGIRLVHISTDCVFSGRQGMYREDAVSDAEDLYGRTKYLGEVNGPGCLTLRTSMIGRELGTCRGLLEWCLSQRGRRISGYTHAVFSGVTTIVFADLVAQLIEREPALSGLFHVSAEPIDKCALLCLVRDIFGLDVEIVPCPVPRVDRSLDSSRFRALVGFEPPGWRTMLAALAAEPEPSRLFAHDDGTRKK